MRRIAALMLLCVFGGLLPSATVLALAAPQQLLPICCRAHGAHACGIMAEMARPATGSQFRQAGCPYSQSLRAITTGTISADFACRTSFGLTVTGIEPATHRGCCRNTGAPPLRSPRAAFFLLRQSLDSVHARNSGSDTFLVSDVGFHKSQLRGTNRRPITCG